MYFDERVEYMNRIFSVNDGREMLLVQEGNSSWEAMTATGTSIRLISLS